jgi:hypothetical protein
MLMCCNEMLKEYCGWLRQMMRLECVENMWRGCRCMLGGDGGNSMMTFVG